jgi:CCR4-NOT complex subunit CAF16
MHEVSDGERRRVQIVSGLMAPWEMLLLDEVTVDLDVLVRQRLLNFLVEECETRGATILYATHIFDGLDAFPTHLCHIQLGTTIDPSPFHWPVRYTTPHRKADGSPSDEIVPGLPQGTREMMEDPNRAGSRLLEVALAWLKVDRVERIAKEIRIHGSQLRGAASLKNVTSDSETFYKKFVHFIILSCVSLCTDIQITTQVRLRTLIVSFRVQIGSGWEGERRGVL